MKKRYHNFVVGEKVKVYGAGLFNGQHVGSADSEFKGYIGQADVGDKFVGVYSNSGGFTGVYHHRQVRRLKVKAA